jgi:ABC-type transport system involved in multi-copper enzyme maturation permease subunit
MMADPVAARPQPRPLSPTAAALRIFDLSLGEMLWSRRTIFMGLVVGLPVVIAALVRGLVLLGAPLDRTLAGPAIFGLMIWAFFVHFSVPVLATFYGTALIADEVEDKTLTYLFTRPIPRGAVLVGKYLAYLACTVCVVLPSVVLVWVLIVPIRGTLGANFLDLVVDLGLLTLGLAAYGAVFALIGAVFKRPLLFGLLFIFGWELLVLALPGYLKRLTVAYYIEGLVPHAVPGDTALRLVQAVFQDRPGVAASLVSLAVIALVALWLAARAVARREYVLEQ